MILPDLLARDDEPLPLRPAVPVGDWIPLLRRTRIECCGCGLTHDVEVRVHDSLGPQWRATPVLTELETLGNGL